MSLSITKMNCSSNLIDTRWCLINRNKYFIRFVYECTLMSSIILFFLKYACNLLRIKPLSNEIIIFLIILLCLLRKYFNFGELFLFMADADHRSYIISIKLKIRSICKVKFWGLLLLVRNYHTKLSSGELSAAPLKISILQYLKIPSFSAKRMVKNHLNRK